MIRIGFIPMLESEQRHQDLLKEVEQYQLIRESTHNVRKGSKILALIGKEMASLGVLLEERYGNQPESTIGLDRKSNLGGC